MNVQVFLCLNLNLRFHLRTVGDCGLKTLRTFLRRLSHWAGRWPLLGNTSLCRNNNQKVVRIVPADEKHAAILLYPSLRHEWGQWFLNFKQPRFQKVKKLREAEIKTECIICKQTVFTECSWGFTTSLLVNDWVFQCPFTCQIMMLSPASQWACLLERTLCTVLKRRRTGCCRNRMGKWSGWTMRWRFIIRSENLKDAKAV